MTEMNPIVNGQVIFPHVRMQEKMTVSTMPTNVNATEQAPWFESALKAMDIARRELPVQNMKAITIGKSVWDSKKNFILMRNRALEEGSRRVRFPKVCENKG
jgi:hypothetical protein